MKNIDKFKNLYEYEQAKKTHLDEILAPLKIIGISNFGYAKITKDQRYFTIGNHEKYTDLLYQNDFINKKDTFKEYASHEIFEKKYERQIRLWDINAHHLDCKRKAANVWNGISIYNVNQDHVEICALGGTVEDTQLPAFLFKNSELLEQFMVYFRQKAKEIIDVTDKSKTVPIQFNSYNTIETIFEEKVDLFRKAIGANMLMFKNELNEFDLSARELECLFYKNMGFTAKEIAQKLNISFRTVETHFEKIKTKSGSKNMQCILNFCKDRGLI